MKCLLVLPALLLLIGCQATNVSPEDGVPLVSNSFEGAWSGEIRQFTTKNLPDSNNGQLYELLFLNCGQAPEIWLKQDESGFQQIYGNYRVDSKSGNHILSLIVDGGAWVETQTWTLVSVNSSLASIQWNRMVSNPKLSAVEPLRVFGQMGFGSLYKVSSDCDIWGEDGNNSSNAQAL